MRYLAILSGAAFALAACEPVEGTQEWCEQMREEPREEWSTQDAETFARECVAEPAAGAAEEAAEEAAQETEEAAEDVAQETEEAAEDVAEETEEALRQVREELEQGTPEWCEKIRSVRRELWTDEEADVFDSECEAG